MKWFYNLEEKYRIIITVVAWIPTMIFLYSEPFNALFAFLFLAIAGVCTIMTAIIHDKEKKQAEQAKWEGEEQARTENETENRNKFGNFENVDDVKVGEVAEFAATPSQIIKLVKNGNEDMQSNISYCNIGDDCMVEFDYSKCLYMCVADGVEVGYFPDGVIEEMAGRGKFAIKINSITSNANDKYVIKVGIHLPVDASEDSVNFPIHTKTRGVTFGGRQEFLRDSKEGDALIIKHAPTPGYPDTIAIINERTGNQLGNIGADLAASLLGEFGEGCAFRGVIQEITGGEDGKNNLGCNLTIEGVA